MSTSRSPIGAGARTSRRTPSRNAPPPGVAVYAVPWATSSTTAATVSGVGPASDCAAMDTAYAGMP